MDVVIGAGMGGLAAAIALARAGREVTIFEGRSRVGGLAGGVALGGRQYDGGPYILLDRPGLEWAFEQLGVPFDLELIPLEEPYRVERADAPTFSLYDDLDRTADGLEQHWPGAGDAYRRWVRRMAAIYDDLVPLQRIGRPNALQLLRTGALRHAPFLLRGLAHHLRQSGLPQAVQDGLGIWTHIAGQPLEKAPAPLAFVPAIIHTRGAFVARGGIHRIPERLAEAARSLGVRIVLDQRVDRIVRSGRRVLGVEVAGERIDADRVISNAPGIATYAQLLHPPDPELREQLSALPLQSPGVAAYLQVDAEPEVPFLRFRLEEGGWCRLLVHPGAVDPDRRGHARLLGPVAHEWAEGVGVAGQNDYLDRLLEEDWWHEGLASHKVLARRIPEDWGRRYLLWRNSMNPVMTAQFMRRGRLPHGSPVADNLYLAGSATHPGQWVSFCAISGLIAARQALQRTA